MARQLDEAMESEEALDGRLRRSTVTREKIVVALTELVREGEFAPTAEQVAARAGVGMRTVFRHFDDMESLHAELSHRIEGEVLPLVEHSPPAGSLKDRARGLLERRAAVYERIAPFRRASEVHRWRSPFLQKEHARTARRLRADLLQALPELESADPTLVEAIDLVASFEAWDRLRRSQRLGRDRAYAVLESAVLSLLERETSVERKRSP